MKTNKTLLILSTLALCSPLIAMESASKDRDEFIDYRDPSSAEAYAELTIAKIRSQHQTEKKLLNAAKTSDDVGPFKSTTGNLNYQDMWGNTMLMEAAKKGHIKVARLLVEKGADIHLLDLDGATALHDASRNGHEELVKLLLENGADVNLKIIGFKETPLFLASKYGHTGMVKFLLENGAKVDAYAVQRVTPLITASSKGHLDIVELLIKYGADINAQSTKGATAIKVASSQGHLDIVNLLKEAGAK